MDNPESKDIDSDSQENYQEEHVEFDPAVSLQHLTHEMEQLRQTVEDKDSDVMMDGTGPRISISREFFT